jgi:hypothetical protein
MKNKRGQLGINIVFVVFANQMGIKNENNYYCSSCTFNIWMRHKETMRFGW